MASALDALLAKSGGTQPSALDALLTKKRVPTGQLFSGGTLSDVFDVLQVGQFATAGIVTGKGVRRGIQERTSFGELLPETFRNTFLGSVAELGLNIFGDPLTYIPVGGLLVKGIRAVPSGAKAIQTTKGVARAGFERVGLAIPDVTRAGKELRALDIETRTAPLREALRQRTIMEAQIAEQATDFVGAFRTTALEAAGKNALRYEELRRVTSAYFDIPGAIFTRARKEGMDATQARLLAGQAQQEFLSTLSPDVRNFVEAWGSRAARDHAAQLAELRSLGYAISPEWEGIYLRRVYARNLTPEQWALEISKDPGQAARVLGQLDRLPDVGAARQGRIPGGALPKARQVVSEEREEALGFIREFDRRYALQGELNAKLIARGKLQRTIANQYTLKDEAVTDLTNRIGPEKFSQLFKQFSGATWGPLNGKWVPKEVFDMLAGEAHIPGRLEKWVGYWKHLKTIDNPATHARNIRQNFAIMQAKLGTRGLLGVMEELPGAWDDIAKNSDMFRRAKAVNPAFVDTFVTAELGKIARATENVGEVSNKIVATVLALDGKLARAYELEELVPKMGIFRWAVKKGMSDEAAAKLAETTLYNYREVPPLIATMRAKGIWPFITFPYKVATETVPAVLTHPGRLAQQVKGVRAFTDPMSPEEERVVPGYMRSGGYVKLPWKDWKGRPIFYDLTYELFFGDVAESGSPLRAVAGILTGNMEARHLLPLLTPFGQLAAELAFNTSAFSEGQIVKPEERAWPERFRHVARFALPGGAFAAIETGLAATGAEQAIGLKPESTLARAATGTPTTLGVEPPSVLQALGGAFAGVRSVPLDVEKERQARVIELRSFLGELEKRMFATVRDRGILDPRERGRRLEFLRRQRMKAIKEFQETGIVRR